MPYWRLFYHIVWATKSRLPLLTPDAETQVYRIVGAKCDDLGAVLYAANGMPDHTHVVVAVPPRIALSAFVGQLKGSSSHFINTELDTAFAWQAGYGVFTVSARNLDRAIDYVRRQKEHHKAGTIIPALERFMDTEDGPR
jgi:putative transposase